MTFRNWLPAALACAFALCRTDAASAALVTFNYNGTVTSSSVAGTASTFTGTITYDTSGSLFSQPTPYNTVYTRGSDTLISFTSGSYSFSQALSSIDTQFESSDFPNDTLAFISPGLVLELDSPHNSSITFLAIPSTIPSLADFTLYHQVSADGANIVGDVLSLQSQPVP
jgi:hypothetical protein